MASERGSRAAYAREYRKNNREKVLAQRRANYKKKMQDPVKYAAERAYRREYNKAYHGSATNKLRKRARDLQMKYGLTVSQFDAMLEHQNGKCDICGIALHGGAVVDHCHTSGKVRSLLCKDCNTGLGHFRDDTETLSRAITYLELHSKNALV